MDAVEAAAPGRPAAEPGYAFCRRHGVLVAELAPERARIVHRPDADPLILAELRRHLGRPLVLEAVEEARFEQLLAARFRDGRGSAMQAIEDLGEAMDLVRVAGELAEPEDLLEAEDDAPIIRLINALLAEAIREQASDIHIEPYGERLVVRMRVDGVLREVLSPRPELAPLLVSRIKVMARLDIAEKRLPQDGRISLRVGGHAVDVRVSTLPTGAGERVVLRILDKQAGRLDLGQLGMAPATLAGVERLIRRPSGILLVTGPTGSGKTTTLYAILQRLNEPGRNIVTVEDPVEYDIPGIGQTQVNPRIGLSFARGLRAILRQDPDVVMVGEIRDLETAEIAVQASLTGHLVLSTLHTRSAVGAVTRLRDMGIEPYLLSASLIGVIAQRLVRLLCPRCRRPAPATAAERAALGVGADEAAVLHHPGGCPACGGTGYRGRSGIYELVPVDERMRSLIHDGAAEQALEAHARSLTPGIREDGRRRVLAGETSLEEVLRVTAED
ncbi:type II secretion system ATPase GspE [Inmirania thermothiophila]|uniref:Type II secretion system protein E n=1 Tax=Inmirania thermothiophila TaxID=1750597 RepID=A0A3N1XSE8_9GAMM|nr:type II secretion system ATPase GspE [Inmirania thermothiophila]ROR29576.1 type II secretion system protein E (GspE) [Inmirania thermothiophila]